MKDTNIFSQDKLFDLYGNLPEDLRNAMFSVDVAGKISAIGKKFGLSIEQTGVLATTTGLVMLGALHPRSFIQKLEEDLKIDRSKAIDIAREVNHEIFFPVRENLKKIHGMSDTDEVTSDKQMNAGDALKNASQTSSQAPVSQVPKIQTPVGPQKISDILQKSSGTPIAPQPLQKENDKKPEASKVLMQEIKPGSSSIQGGDRYREPLE